MSLLLYFYIAILAVIYYYSRLPTNYSYLEQYYLNNTYILSTNRQLIGALYYYYQRLVTLYYRLLQQRRSLENLLGINTKYNNLAASNIDGFWHSQNYISSNCDQDQRGLGLYRRQRQRRKPSLPLSSLLFAGPLTSSSLFYYNQLETTKAYYNSLCLFCARLSYTQQQTSTIQRPYSAFQFASAGT